MEHSQKYLDDLNESSFTRLKHWLDNYECVTISAYRGNQFNTVSPDQYKVDPRFKTNLEKPDKESYTPDEKRKRSAELLKKLIDLKYGVTSLIGTYPEEGENKGLKKFLSEKSFLVVNKNNDPDFKKNMTELGIAYNQDSIGYKTPDTPFILIVTNNSGELFDEIKIGQMHRSKEDDEYYSSLRKGKRAKIIDDEKDYSIKYKYGVKNKDIVDDPPDLENSKTREQKLKIIQGDKGKMLPSNPKRFSMR